MEENLSLSKVRKKSLDVVEPIVSSQKDLTAEPVKTAVQS